MASTNFKIFAENAASDALMDDVSYTADSQRQTGVAPGVALPSLHNKLYKQATVMSAAIAQCIVQAGFDAKDNDYIGLVSGIRQTFAGSVLGVTPDAKGNIDIAAEVRKIRDEKAHTYSVNGVYPDSTGNVDITSVIEEIRDEKSYVFSVNDIKPDKNGNVDLVTVIDAIKKAMYPAVGDIICTKNSQNPSKRFPGTTWELLDSEMFLMSMTQSQYVGKTGGSNTHSITTAQMPSHNHSVSLTAAGGHSHTRGSMNITGTFSGVGEIRSSPQPKVAGAFYVASSGGGIDVSNDGNCDDLYGFDASRSWTGSTSWCDNHTHSVSVGSVGSGQSYDSRPKYIGVYMWIRTK